MKSVVLFFCDIWLVMAPFYRHHGSMETVTQHRLVGKMVWCRADGTQLPLVTAVQVSQGTNTQPSQVTDITGTWQNTTGIRLHVSSAASRGNYHGQLTWALTNSPG
nr:hypothetical protein AAX72_05820 [Levilactobacillus brevis]